MADDRSDSSAAARLGRSLRSAWVIYLGLVALSVAIVAVTVLVAHVLTAPPRVVRLATGHAGGAYALDGERLRDWFARYGVTLELVPTAGSVENLERLTSLDAGHRVDAAILQGGVGHELADQCRRDASQACPLESLGGLFYEPVWVFARRCPGEGAGVVGAGDFEIGADRCAVRDLGGLVSKRVAAGPERSGVRALALLLLADNGLDADKLVTAPDGASSAAAGKVTLVPLGSDDAAAALLDGRVDAAIFVTAPAARYIETLLRAPDVVELTSFERAAAYERTHPFLTSLTLPRGVIDLGQDIPRSDVSLLAPSAALVVRHDLHTAIEALFLQASSELFAAGDKLAAPGEFPSARLATFPLSDEAKRYFERGGPSFLRRWLPFWAANLVDRIWVLAIPIVTLLYPLVKSAPPVFNWQVRRRIDRLYKHLHRLERESRGAESREDLERVRSDLRRLLHEVGGLRVPLTFSHAVFDLRTHIRLIEEIVGEALEGRG